MTFSDGRYRGYARFDLSRERLGADLRAMESVQKREAACNTLATFVVEDGKPGAVKNSTWRPSPSAAGRAPLPSRIQPAALR